jgi:hypothetical protein
MAKNETRSMNAELHQGLIDGRYMQLAPGWSLDQNPPQTERLDWPTYEQVENHRTPGTFRVVPSTDNTLIQTAKQRHGVFLSAHPQGRATQVDPGAYHGDVR